MRRIDPTVRYVVSVTLTISTRTDVQCDVLASVALHEIFTNGIYGYIIHAGEYGIYVYTSMYGVLPFDGTVMVDALNIAPKPKELLSQDFAMQQVPADNLILAQQCTIFVRQRSPLALNGRSECRVHDQFFVDEFFDSRLEVPQ